MSDELSVTVRGERGVVIAEVTGDIDMSTVAGLRERLSGLADGGQPLIVDLSRVTFIDSAGLGVLIGAARRAAAHGGSLHAVCSLPRTRRLLWLTGVDRRIPLSATVDEALMALTASRDAPGPDELCGLHADVQVLYRLCSRDECFASDCGGGGAGPGFW